MRKYNVLYNKCIQLLVCDPQTKVEVVKKKAAWRYATMLFYSNTKECCFMLYFFNHHCKSNFMGGFDKKEGLSFSQAFEFKMLNNTL